VEGEGAVTVLVSFDVRGSRPDELPGVAVQAGVDRQLDCGRQHRVLGGQPVCGCGLGLEVVEGDTHQWWNQLDHVGASRLEDGVRAVGAVQVVVQ
jgi:hypothetical protein